LYPAGQVAPAELQPPMTDLQHLHLDENESGLPAYPGLPPLPPLPLPTLSNLSGLSAPYLAPMTPSELVTAVAATNYDLMTDGDMEQLSLEIEKERVEYLEKSKQLQDQLRELRSEIEVLKVGEKQTLYDQLHEEQLRSGDDKYSTLKKVGFLIKFPNDLLSMNLVLELYLCRLIGRLLMSISAIFMSFHVPDRMNDVSSIVVYSLNI
jgi:Ezrin/radixin/moesin family